MVREILFKAKRSDGKGWVCGYVLGIEYEEEIHTGIIEEFEHNPTTGFSINSIIEVIPETVCQYTGLKDKNGEKIFEGDEVLIREPHRLSQTHYGDNIPLGQYTEQMEPAIKEYMSFVKFNEGCFHTVGNTDYNFSGLEINRPISWEVIKYTYLNKSEMIDRFYSDESCWIEDGDLGYLLEEYGLKDENELMSYLGVELTGKNIHDEK